MKKLFLLLTLVILLSCEKTIPDTQCEVCSTTIVGTGIDRSYQEILCGDDLANVKEGQTWILIDDIACKKTTYCK